MENNKNFYFQVPEETFWRNFKQTLGMCLFYHRHRKRIQAQKVCEQLNISPQLLDRIELGRGRIQSETIPRLLDLYELKVKFDFKFYHSSDSSQKE